MKRLEVDVAVIGAGTAGLNARHEARNFGAQRIVVIEDGPYGTTCARVGCMPSKLLIAAADRAHSARGAGEFGVHPGEVRVDGRQVMARVRRERDRFAGFVVRSVERHPPQQHLRGRARFVGPTALEVTLHEPDAEGAAQVRVEARAVVVATGSRPSVPGIFHGAGDRLLTSDSIFEQEVLPESIAVVGAGVIGLELGQALHRLGVRTTILSNEAGLAGLSDPVVLDEARSVLCAELDLELEATVREVRRVDEGVELVWTRADGSDRRERVQWLLAATGRRANVDGLGLEAAGVAVDAKGVARCDPRTMQCGELPIFMAGDVAATARPLLHEATDEGHIAGENAALWPQVRVHRRRTPLVIVFTRPELAMVGASHAELVAAGEAFEVGTVSWADQGRARVEGRNAGLARVYGQRGSGVLLGAELFGPGVEHLAHLLAWSVQSRLDVVAALGMPFYHPVLEEGLRTALRDLAARLEVDRARDPLYDGPGV